jgi:hypothetical protein
MQKNSRRKVVENKGWIGPQITPTCLSNSLKTFEFRDIQNFKAELNSIIQYIIENSSKSEKIKLFIKTSKNSKSKSKSRSSLAENFLGERVILVPDSAARCHINP